MRIAYITSSFPYGAREVFFLPELAWLEDCGHELTVFPTRPQGAIIHSEAGRFARLGGAPHVLSLAVIAGAVAEVIRAPQVVIQIIRLLARSENLRLCAKNAAVVPKALWVARSIRRSGGVDHIHACWLSTPATVALIVSQVTGIPWSATGHRWDIEEGNLLEPKVRHASWIRTISHRGAASISARVPDLAARLRVIRMGVTMPDEWARPTDRHRIVSIGNLITLKGHRYLIDAVALAHRRGCPITLEIVGDGHLRHDLFDQVTRLELESAVTLLGQLPHDQILEDLQCGRWNAVVIPSIVDRDGATEGVPVVILEAMAHGVPVVATRVGAIAEACHDGAGILVPPGDPEAICDALMRLVSIDDEWARLAQFGRERIEAEFDVRRVVQLLVGGFSAASRPAQHGPSCGRVAQVP